MAKTINVIGFICDNFDCGSLIVLPETWEYCICPYCKTEYNKINDKFEIKNLS